MKARLIRLWRGEVPLARAFWDYAVLGGFVVNLAATLASMILVAVGAPPALAVVAHFLAVPYNILILVAVWRSAGRHPGNKLSADLARATVVIWVALAMIV